MKNIAINVRINASIPDNVDEEDLSVEFPGGVQIMATMSAASISSVWDQVRPKLQDFQLDCFAAIQKADRAAVNPLSVVGQITGHTTESIERLED